MPTVLSGTRSRRFRPAWCLGLSAICLGFLLSRTLAVRRASALRRAAGEARQEAACAALAAKEYQAGRRALSAGDQAGAARHFAEVNRWSWQAEHHMRNRAHALRYWW